MKNNDIPWEKLEAYIEGILPPEETIILKKMLDSSPAIYAAYIELREAMYHKKTGESLAPQAERIILEHVKRAADKGPVWRLIARVHDGIVRIASGMPGDDAPVFVHASASAVRGEAGKTGAVSVTHAVAGCALTLVLTPRSCGDGCELALYSDKKRGYAVELRIAGEMVERIPDLDTRNHFDSLIGARAEAEIMVGPELSPVCTIALRFDG